MADNGYTIAQAYIQCMPSMDKFGSELKGQMDTEGEKAGGHFSGGFKKGVKVLAAEAAAAAAAVGKTVWDSVKGFADYEQLVGGIEKLFGETDFQAVVDNASAAFESAGMSANEYMETVTNFSASLIESLGKDTAAAVDYADMAITDMSDNANVFGTDMASIQNAYQGFAKQNYTMLDNLKLGYGGTKTEMERLITDAEKLDSSFQATRDANGELTMSFADVVDAIHIVQTDMNITGTTAKEAGETVEGSAKTMKAAWKNLITGLGDSNSDIKKLTGDFTSSFETMLGNVVPVIETSLNNISVALPALIDSLLPVVTNTLTNMLPNLITAVSGIIKSLGNALPDIVGNLVQMLPGILQDLFANVGDILGSLLPALANSISQVLLNLPSMLVGAVGGIVTGVANLFTGIADAFDKAIAPRFSEEDGAFAHTVAAFESNGEKAFSDAANNLKMAWARVIGNTDWQDALDNLTLAEDALDSVYEEYTSFKSSLAEWSPEAAEMDFMVKSGTVTALMDQISSLVDGEGHALPGTSGDLLDALAQQVNDLLGEEVLTVEKDTLAEAVIKQVQASYDAGEDPYEAVRNWLDKNYPDLTNGGIDYETLTELSIKYNTSSQTESPEVFLRRELEAKGWKEADIETICNLLATDGDVRDAWFGTTNGAFAEAIRKKTNIPENVDLEAAVSLIITESQNGSDMDTIITKLNENFGSDVDWRTVVDITVNGQSDVDQALEDLQKLTYATYAQKSAEMAMDEAMAMKRQWGDETEAFAEAYQQYLDAIQQHDYDTAETAYQAAQTHRDALQGMQGTADEAAEAYILAMRNIQAANEGTEPFSSFDELQEKEPDFVASMGNVMDTITGFSGELDGIDQQMLDTARDILSNAETLGGGWKKLSDEARDQIALSLQQSENWMQVADNMGISTTQVGELGTLLNGYFATFGDEIGVSADRIQGWLEYNDQLMPAVEALGLDWDSLAQILEVLAGNEDLAKASADGLAESTGTAGEAVEGVSDAISGEVPEVEAAALGLAAAMIPPIDEDDFNEVGETAGSAVGAGLESTAPDAVEKAETLASDMIDGVSSLPGDMETTGSDSGSGMNTGVDQWSDTISSTIFKIYEFFSNQLGSGLASNMGTWGYSAGDSFTTGLGLTSTSVAAEAQAIADSVYNPLNSLSWRLQSAGYFGGQGLYNGLDSWTGSIIGWAHSVAGAVSATLRAALKVRSPSKVMEEIGVYVAEGLAEGLSYGTDTVVSVAEDMADSLLSVSGNMLDGFDRMASETIMAEGYGSSALIGAINRAAGSGDPYQESPYGQGGMNDIRDTLYMVLEALDRISRMQMVTDTGALVGELADPMDRAFEAIRLKDSRG